MGVLLGKIVDADGKMLAIPNIVIERMGSAGQPAQDTYYLSTYEEDELAGLPPWGESFALGDLPAGEYRLRFIYRIQEEVVVEIVPGELTWVTLRVDD
jgi:hypothetical protein